MVDNLKEAGRFDVACAMLLTLGFFICVAAASWAVMSTDRQGLVIPFGFFALFFAGFAVLYATYAAGWQSRPDATTQPQHYESTQREYATVVEDEDATAQPESAAEYATEGEVESETTAQEISPSALKERANFYIFLYGVCTQGIVGETAWAQRKLPEAKYREWIKLLVVDGIVSEGGRGVQRTVHKTFEQALESIAAQIGDPDFWEPVAGLWDLEGADRSTLFVMYE